MSDNNIIEFPSQEEEAPFAVCTDCKHFQNAEFHSPRRDCWYNHFCLVQDLPTARDPYDGKVKSYKVGFGGQKVFSYQQHPNCHDVNNDGRCEYFESRQNFWRWLYTDAE